MLPDVLDLTALQNQALRTATLPGSPRAVPARPQPPTAAERVLAAELQARGATSDALSMMVSSVARMVQAGRSSASRWSAH